VPLEETLTALSKLREDGRTRNFGVSNFPAGLLERAIGIAPVFCNQVEYHPFLDQSRLLELARANDVLITAYSPLAHGKVPDDETLTRIGDSHGKSAGQVALRWLLDQPGVSPIPKASSRARREENFDVFDFQLSDEEQAEIARLPKDVRTANPPWAPDWDA
jgi:2,5-diketo-D-gluconate reductase B